MDPAVTPQTGGFRGEGGVPIHTVAWPLPGARADVVVVHGYAEHAGRYEHVAAALVGAGFSAHALDQRGHGRSGGSLGEIDSWARLVGDLESFISSVRSSQETKRPLFLVGHSMGALATATVLARRRVEVDAAVMSGIPLVQKVETSPLVIPLMKLMSRVTPRLPITALEADYISRDPDVVEAYVSDPFVYRGKINARTGTGILAATDWLRNHLGDIDQPVLFLCGTDDKLTAAEGSTIAYEGVASSDKNIERYEGLYHEVFNEPERETVLSDMLSWLEKHV
ncbi:MAG: lysophospholipase [Actinobacteria bacterium]|nr:MAG: lysophospholipase [Actinomycetota bacterium]RIK06637.1 MAG: hypothetical protein DCC48_06945 [Acidobacteriota bacterium]